MLKGFSLSRRGRVWVMENVWNGFVLRRKLVIRCLRNGRGIGGKK